MAFKRYDGFIGSFPQKKIDKGLTKCPFCGEDPHWLLEIKQGFSTASMTCMCEKCNAKLYSENSGFSYSDNLLVVDVGNKNLNKLSLNGTYHITALNSLSNSMKIKGTDGNTINKEESNVHNNSSSNITSSPITPIQSSSYEDNRKKNGIIWGSIISIFIFIACMVWIFAPLGGIGQPSASDLEPVQQSSMQVEELAGYYYVTITGSAKNTSNKTMDYVSITFTLYDASGNVVGTAIDNQNGVGAGETWIYSATGMSSTNRPVSWKSTDVTVLCY